VFLKSVITGVSINNKQKKDPENRSLLKLLHEKLVISVCLKRCFAHVVDGDVYVVYVFDNVLFETRNAV
jgi:hypothetical protein